MRLSSRVKAISPSPTVSMDARAKEMLRQGVDVISFGVGEPDFDTPRHIREAAALAIEAGFTRYTPVPGIAELREALVERIHADLGLEYAPTQILVSSGAKESLYHAVMTLCEPGDEVLVPAPYWVTYPEQIKLAGGTPVAVETTDATDFRVTPGLLAGRATPKTRLLILNSPSNPTGSVYTRDELAAIADFCRERDIMIISDEVYDKLIYEGEHVSIATIGPDAKRRTVLINAASKSYAMTGWRIGYTAAEPEIVKAMSALQSHSTTHPAAMAQKAAVAAFAGPQDELAGMKEEFRRRRDYLLERLGRIPGLRVRRPAGAFYAFPNIGDLLGRRLGDRVIRTDLELSEILLTEGRVAIVPGTAFGAPGHLRISYATSIERIRKGMDRVEKVLTALR